ncbi:MAG: sugar transferase [Actinobacteria bacterium]|nr:sugar transferase [Actinomycetota bacterium]
MSKPRERGTPIVEPGGHAAEPDGPDTVTGPDAAVPARPRNPDDTGPITSRAQPPLRDLSDDAPMLARLNAIGFRLVMLLDGVLIYLAAVASVVVRYGLRWPTYSVTHYLVSFGVLTAIFVASLYLGGLYEREPRLGAPPALPRAVRQTLAAAGLFVLSNLVLTGAARELGWIRSTRVVLPLPIPNLVALIVVAAAGVAFNRWWVARERTRREGPPKILLAGNEADLEIARRHIGLDQRRSRIVVEVSEPAQILPAVRRTDVTDVVVVTGRWLDELYPHAVERLDQAGITMLLRVTGRETMFGLERLREVGGLPFVLLRPQTMPRSRRHFKRLFDLTVLAVSAPALLVLIGIIALHQLVAVGRPLLYWQERVGAGGRRFQMLKFRTMKVDAEAATGAKLAEQDDPRVIPACRWVRATRMDELPQVWNVLRGEMSLVGPRPERPELTARFETAIPGYARRHALPPGLTGLAQIHGRYHTDPEYKLGYDLQYLVNWSPVVDLEILARTVWVVLARRL